MKRNKSILHLCEIILTVLMLILILNLYLTKLLVDPDLSYKAMYQSLCMTLAFLVLCIVLALIQRELLARLLNNAYRDVTGIHNKKSLEKKLQELNDRANTFGVGVMMFDLNNLKHVNDTYGHEKGDEFLQDFQWSGHVLSSGHDGQSQSSRLHPECQKPYQQRYPEHSSSKTLSEWPQESKTEKSKRYW